MPKLDIAAIPVRTGTTYPEAFRHVVRGRERQALGDAGGLTQFGVNLTRLRPGAASSLRHWHEVEDEMAYVLDGELTLVDDTGETRLGPGDAATFKAGDQNGHHIVNRSGRDALLLEIGTRAPRDVGHYSDVDLMVRYGPGDETFTRRSGEPY